MELLLLSLLLPLVNGLAFRPSPTQKDTAHDPNPLLLGGYGHEVAYGYSPAITSAPKPRRQVLEKRINTDLTCGYVNGVQLSSLTCLSGYICEENRLKGAVGCCPEYSRGCTMQTTCVDSTALPRVCGTTSCGEEIGRCASATAPYCVTYRYPDGKRIFGCNTIKAFGVQSILYAPDKVLRPVSDDPADTTTTDDAFDPTLAPAPNTSAPPTDPTTSPPGPTTTNPIPPPDGGSKSNTGAIVGGVVGGIGLICISAVAIFLIRRRSARHPVDPAPPALGPTAYQTQQGVIYGNPPPPPGGMAYVPQQQGQGYGPPMYDPTKTADMSGSSGPGSPAPTYVTPTGNGYEQQNQQGVGMGGNSPLAQPQSQPEQGYMPYRPIHEAPNADQR